jgi:hypothetical protein
MLPKNHLPTATIINDALFISSFEQRMLIRRAAYAHPERIFNASLTYSALSTELDWEGDWVFSFQILDQYEQAFQNRSGRD